MRNVGDKIKRRVRQEHSYVESWSFIILSTFCCCFKETACYLKRAKRNEYYGEAMKRLSIETDIVQMIELLRQSSFLNRLQFMRH